MDYLLLFSRYLCYIKKGVFAVLCGYFRRQEDIMKKRIIAVLCAVACMVSLTACGSAAGGSADSDLAYIKDKGTLVVGITDFAPMDYKDDNGNWIGFDADMATKIASSLGVKAEFVEIDWDNKILELDNKSIDVVWNGMTLTDEVKNSMECTKPYLNNAQVVVVKSDNAGSITSKDAASALKFAVEAGSAGEAAAEDNGFDFTSVTSQADAVMEVEAGTSDACIIDLLMAGAMVGEGTSYPDLAAYINDQFKTLYVDGTMNSIAEIYGVQYAILAQ